MNMMVRRSHTSPNNVGICHSFRSYLTLLIGHVTVTWWKNDLSCAPSTSVLSDRVRLRP
jgi:hypothetical protein